ncbi:fatty acid desaturase family protein [Ferruginibacter sp.]|nr:fatty acid desaturase [Ferruginibacter sp.]
MKDKHIYIAEDSELLKTIYQQVGEKLLVNKSKVAFIIVLKFIFYFSLTISSYWALFKIANPFLFVFCFVLYGFLSLLFAFNFSHDFSHNTVFKSKKINNLCFTIIYSLVGAHAEGWKQRHVNSHHYAPNVEGYDSDLKISKLIRVIPGSQHFWYHKFQHVYALIAYTTYSLFWVFIKDWIILFSKEEHTKNKGLKYHLSFWVQKIFYFGFILALPLLFSLQSWPIVLLGFLFMHLTQSLFLLLTFFMTHHVEATTYPSVDDRGYINSSWLMNQIKSSNDMHPFSKTANFILGGFNNHIAHHLFPHIHHIHYPALNRILYDLLLQYKIKPNQTTYIGGIVSHLRLLKKMSTK